MDIVGIFVGVDGFKIIHHPHHVEFVGHSVSAVDIARCARDVERGLWSTRILVPGETPRPL